MTLTATAADRAAELSDFTRHALKVGADFTLHVETATEFRAVVRAIGGHNDYNPDRAAALLGPLIGEMAKVTIEHFVAGPALYFQLPFWTHQRIDSTTFGMGTKYTDDERKALAQRVRNVGKMINADEISVRQFTNVGGATELEWFGTGEHPYEVRLWWD
jgi:hypothetical protein